MAQGTWQEHKLTRCSTVASANRGLKVPQLMSCTSRVISSRVLPVTACVGASKRECVWKYTRFCFLRLRGTPSHREKKRAIDNGAEEHVRNGMPYRFVAGGSAPRPHQNNTICPARVAHLVDGEEIGAFGSVRVVPLQSLVHVCFALAKLERQAFVDKAECKARVQEEAGNC